MTQSDNYNYKIENEMFNLISHIKNGNYLEFGVREGRSTSKFLELCKKNNGKLLSVDIEDYSKLFIDKNWKFLNCRDDNFAQVDKNITNDLDVIYLDSLHEAKHVRNIFYHYFFKLKINGYFFIDDISWLPYLKNKERNNFYCEINNKETFEIIIEIFNQNMDNFDLSFSFVSSGLCIIKKKKNYLKKEKKIITREVTIKNIVRKILK